MTLKDECVEAMAESAAETQLGKGCWARMPEAERNIWRGQQQFGALPALLAHLKAKGWKLVPAEATEEMLRAGFARFLPVGTSIQLWRDQLAAAPSPLDGAP